MDVFKAGNGATIVVQAPGDAVANGRSVRRSRLALKAEFAPITATAIGFYLSLKFLRRR
jgi:hypothetical protein